MGLSANLVHGNEVARGDPVNPWKAIRSQLDEWGDALRRRIIAEVLEIVAEVLEARPTAAETLRAKAAALKER